jgi:hypothetical protein
MVKDGILEIVAAVLAVFEEKQIWGWFVSVILLCAIFLFCV